MSSANQRGPSRVDISAFTHAGTTDLTVESWQPACLGQCGALSTVAKLTGTLWLMPCPIGRDCVVDRIGFEVTAGGTVGSVARIGMYSAKGPNNIYPGTLLADSGSVATTGTGTISATVDLALTAGLYWLVYECSVAAPTLRAQAANATRPMFGMGAVPGGNPTVGLNLVRTYAALPATFTAGAVRTTAADTPFPTFFYRLSA